MSSNTNKQNAIFIRSSLDFKKDVKVYKLTSLSHMYVKNGEILAAVSDRLLIRQSVSNSDRFHEIVLPIQNSDAIAHVHLAFTGFHAIVSTKLGNNFYIHMKSNAVHHLKKLRTVVTAVGWNPECLKDSETGPILLGTQQGSVVELSMTSSGVCHVLKELTTQLDVDSRALPISDIQLFVIYAEEAKPKVWLALFVQHNRVIIIRALLGQQQIKTMGFASSASLQAGFIPDTMPATSFHGFFNNKDAQLYAMSSTKVSELFNEHCFLVLHPASNEPTKYAWLSPDGIIVGKVDLFAENVQHIFEEEFNLEHRLIEGRIEPPVGIVLTDYHAVIAYSSRIVAVSLLSPHNVVFEDIWPAEFGSALGFTSDPSSDFMWLFTNAFSLRYRANDEARYVWKNFLDRKEFNRALQIARARINVDPEAYEIVLQKQADWYIGEKNYTAAAEILSQSSEPFESVVSKLLSVADDRKMGIKTLMEKKLERLTKNEDRIKRDCLVFWLLEIQLSELAMLRRSKENEKEVKELTEHLQRFIMRKNVYESIQTNIEAVYRSTIAHADFDMLYFIANAVKDTNKIINILILREQYSQVLDVIKSQKNYNLFYEMSPLLIEHIPKQVILYCIEQKDKIKPNRLLAALTVCGKSIEMATAAVKYIEYLINYNQQIGKELHNLFIQLMAKFYPEKLIEYFKKFGINASMIPYDLDFAIRTCEEKNMQECLVILYCINGMYEDSVEMALKIDISLAKKCAKMMEEGEDGEDELFDMGNKTATNNENIKLLWLKIAKHLIAEGSPMKDVIGLIEESGRLVTIKDLLPLFPKFTNIDEFKEAIVDYLNVHSENIKNINAEMKDSTQTSADIRQRIERIKNRSAVIKAGDTCAHCGRQLAGRPFFYYNCRHFFHYDCLQKSIFPFLSKEDQAKLEFLIKEETRFSVQVDLDRKSGNTKSLSKNETQLEKIGVMIRNLIATDCPLCGIIAIEQIDKSFMSDEEFLLEEKSWMIEF